MQHLLWSAHLLRTGQGHLDRGQGIINAPKTRYIPSRSSKSGSESSSTTTAGGAVLDSATGSADDFSAITAVAYI